LSGVVRQFHVMPQKVLVLPDVNALNMASLIDLLSELPTESEIPSAPNDSVIEENPPLPDNEDTSVNPTGDTCWSAMKTVWDRVREKCGTGVSIKIGPATIDVPATIVYIASGEGSSTPMPRDKQIETIMDTNWCKDLAERLYSSMSVFDHGSPTYFLGLANVEETIAEAVVNEIGQK